MTTWNKLTEEFLRAQCGDFTSRDLATYFQARSSYIYPDDIILATANRMLRKQQNAGNVCRVGWSIGSGKHYMTWRAV